MILMTKILVIEDEQALREEILDLLEVEGFETVSAENGEIGVRLAQEHSPNLILCDVMMPGLDGHDVLLALRQRPATAVTPFIFLTAKGTPDDFRQGLRLGADDYITKPFEHAELLEAISTRLGRQTVVSQLHEQVNELQQSNLLKDDFLGAVSQEMRQPLTNMLMAIQMLQQSPREEQLQRYASILRTECSRQINLINHLLELQRLEANARPVMLELLTLQEWVPDIVEPFKSRAKERQQSIWSSISPHLPALLTDRYDLQKILEELLDNACKYTAPGGKITLEAYRVPSATSTQSIAPVTIVISNEGEIAQEALPRLFEKFYRVPKGDIWRQGGNGLGLTLVKKLVERLSSTTYVVSEAGWTQFFVQLGQT